MGRFKPILHCPRLLLTQRNDLVTTNYMHTDDIGAKHSLINPKSVQSSAAVADFGYLGLVFFVWVFIGLPGVARPF